MSIFKCSNCEHQYPDSIKLELNGRILCPNCLLIYVYKNENELLKENILIDNDYTYTLSKELLINLIKTKLSVDQYITLKKKYTDSWYLHDDFYDEDGVAI